MLQNSKDQQSCCNKNCEEGRKCPLRDSKKLDKALQKTPKDYLKRQGFKL